MPANASTPDKYVEFVKAQYAKTFAKCAFEPVAASKKDGFEARELKYTAEVSGFKMVYNVLYVFRGGKAYTLTGGNMADFIDDGYKADLKAFFASFKLK